MNNQTVYDLRENTGTSGIVKTARTPASVLAEHDIPHLIVGGLAVPEHGYLRMTINLVSYRMRWERWNFLPPA